MMGPEDSPANTGPGRAADFFAAVDFFAGAPRRPARGRAPTVLGESAGPKSSYVALGCQQPSVGMISAKSSYHPNCLATIGFLHVLINGTQTYF